MLLAELRAPHCKQHSKNQVEIKNGANLKRTEAQRQEEVSQVLSPHAQTQKFVCDNFRLHAV